MMTKLHAFGRDWTQGQFHELLGEAIKQDLYPEFGTEMGVVTCGIGHAISWQEGRGKTPWEALVDALEKREGEL